MPDQDTWSDSEDGDWDGSETGVLLGLPDGAISSSIDLVDPAVSRGGGVPSFLPSIQVPPPSVSKCKNCGTLMELLVQVWCPMEDSPMDRVLYVWGCARRGCQRRDGSIRAYRSLKYNDRFAAKLKNQRDAASKVECPTKPLPKASANPFLSGPNLVAVGPQLFGSGNLFQSPSSATEPLNDVAIPPETDIDEPPATKDELEHLAEALESTQLNDDARSLWGRSPSYSPFYISSTSEYLADEGVENIHSDVSEKAILQNSAKGETELYERSSTDSIFDKFVRRTSAEGSQCFRYELSGTPLPYHTDAVYRKLFPLSAPTQDNLPSRRVYHPSAIPTCPICRAPRTFECQLMPNLISCLERHRLPMTQSDEDRRREVSHLLSRGAVQDSPVDAKDAVGMEWGTCMVFSCSKDCRQDPRDAGVELQECFVEESVIVQWE